MNSEALIRSRVNIITWLFAGCLLIFGMVVIGGITRLTGSGLSITKWDIVMGTLPPFSAEQWQHEFGLYMQTPQYLHINSHFTLSDFKQIYWWEYIHRLLGRLIGLVFIIPFLYFLFTKQLNRPLLLKCIVLFAMGGLQGFIGWYMVSSGLVDIPSVSHLRLALHLITAFFTFGLTFWFAFSLIHENKKALSGWQRNLFFLSVITFVVIVLQIVYGAFVAGLKAGLIYNTWPLMGDKLIADSVFFGINEMGWRALVNNMSGVQMVHRYLAFFVVIAIVILTWYAKKQHQQNENKLTIPQLQAIYIMLIAVFFQFLLGVLTLILHVPVFLGVLHQAGAFFLFSSSIYLIHRIKNV